MKAGRKEESCRKLEVQAGGKYEHREAGRDWIMKDRGCHVEGLEQYPEGRREAWNGLLFGYDVTVEALWKMGWEGVTLEAGIQVRDDSDWSG